MTFLEFKKVVRRHFQTTGVFVDVNRHHPDPQRPAFSAVVWHQDETVELHVRNPFSEHWNAWLEINSMPTVVGAATGSEAIQKLVEKLAKYPHC
jgi:hypothetical protein